MKRVWPVVGAGVFIGLLVVGSVLSAFGWNPTATIKFGEKSAQREYADNLFGEVIFSPEDGHDGKFYFSQAMDPFYLEPDVHAVYLDRPAYRAQRMLYPTMAGAGGLLSADATAWSLILVNVVAMGLGTWATSLVAMEMGLSPLYGLAFALNPGVFIVLTIDSSGIFALACLMFAVLYVIRGEPVWAVVWMTLAALSRETMLIGVAGLTVYWFRQHRKIPLWFATPWAATAVWWVYVHWRLDEGLSQDTQAVSWPFVGFVEAFQTWVTEPGLVRDMLVGVVLVVASVVILVRSIRRPTALGYAVAGFAFLGTLLVEAVWLRYFDSTRALAPVLTAFVLLVASGFQEGSSKRSAATVEQAAPT